MADSDEISASHRARQQREYESEWHTWYATLSPGERRQLKAQGITGPDGDIQQINGKRRSANEMDLPDQDHAPEIIEVKRRANANAITRVLMELANSKNVPLMLDVMLSGLGCYDSEGETCESLGARHGVSKQRFDFLRNRFIDTFDLPAPTHGRPITERTKQHLERCNKNNSPSISQQKSASFTTKSRPTRKNSSTRLYRSGKN